LITDENGCSETFSYEINEPSPLILLDTTFSVFPSGHNISCYGANDGLINLTISGGTPGYNFEWSNGATTQNLSSLTVGNYSVTITDDNGCEMTHTFQLLEPDSLIINTDLFEFSSGHNISCFEANDGSITAIPNGGSPPYQFNWNTVIPSQNQQIDDIGVGVYTVTLVDSNNCEAQATVVLNGNPLPEIGYSDYGLYCEGEIATISSFVEPNCSCSWEFSTGHIVNQCGDFQIDFNVVGCVDAELSVTNNGCTNTEFIEGFVCFEPIPDASFSQSEYQITTIPSNVQFWNSTGGGYYYEWDFGDGFGSDEINPNHYFPDDQAGTYEIQLVVTSMFGCSDTAYSIVEVQEEFIIYVPNTFTPDGNQFNEIFKPVLTSGYDPYNYHLIIFNRWGEVLFESYDAEIGWDGTYGGEIIKDGTYIWKIDVNDKANAQKRQFKGHINVLR
jgi:gliding motility-associated-like protein